MVSRRDFCLGLGATLAAPGYGLALEQCPAPGLPPGVCSALVSTFQSQQAQAMSQWCWAACVSMICNHHGYPISQSSIVSRVYGGLVDMPGDDRVLVQALNNTWTADNGQKFKISSNVFSPALGAATVDNNVVIDDLKNDRPLLNGSGTHATVTVRADYFRPPGAPPLVQRVHVIDPWPGAAPPPQMARFLTPAEMTPLHLGGSLRFLASVRISPA